MRAEAALGPAPQVVGGPEGRDRCDGGRTRDAHLPAHERQAQPAEVHAERAAGVERVAGAAFPGGRSRAGSARSGDAAAAARLRAPTGASVRRRSSCRPRSRSRRRPGSRRARRGRQRPLAGKRLTRLETREDFDQGSGERLREPRSPSRFGERRDVEIAAAVEERRKLSREIGIAEEQRAGRGSALGCGQRLAPCRDVGSRRTIAPAATRLRLPCRRASRRRPRSPRRRERPPQGRDGRPDDVSSSRAGTRIVSGSSTGRLLGQRCDQRQPRALRPRAEVAAQRGSASKAMSASFRTAGRCRPPWRGLQCGMP